MGAAAGGFFFSPAAMPTTWAAQRGGCFGRDPARYRPGTLDIKAPSLGTYGLWTCFELALEEPEALVAVVAGVSAADVLFDGLDCAPDVVPLIFE